LLDVAVPENASCDGVGLAFMAYDDCVAGDCGPGPSVLIANVGSETSPQSTLQAFVDGALIDSSDIPSLEPGERRMQPIPVSDALVLALVPGNQAVSCAPTENVRVVLDSSPPPLTLVAPGTLCAITKGRPGGPSAPSF
jgi:hypothetical protein